ncbi:MAG: hypothetical protein OSA97_04740 [Nevskia sp.]|nr:hypothetical protein [Nevskia sp.]
MQFAMLTALLLPMMVVAQAQPSDSQALAAAPQADCAQPVPPPRIQPRSEDLDRFDKQLKAYRECVEQYVKTRGDEMKHDNALARANADAANAEVQKLNDFMKRLQDQATAQ